MAQHFSVWRWGRLVHQTHLSFRERWLHVLQQTGEILLTVTHHQKEADVKNDKALWKRLIDKYISYNSIYICEWTTVFSHLSKWLPTTTSFSSTMFGCLSRISKLISLKLLMGIPKHRNKINNTIQGFCIQMWNVVQVFPW